MSTYDVSVIVATYHPDLNKLLTTISQIIKQKGITFEIIISDDGSDLDWFDNIKEFFTRKSFSDYKLVKNKKNVGTVRNIYNSICEAKGKYVFCTSPGDYLHDELTLSDFFHYAENTNSIIVFGNALYYSVDIDNNPVLHSFCKTPFWPEIFNSNKRFSKEVSFFSGNYIVGATIFRETKTFKKQLESIKTYCKYVEDNTSVAFTLLEGEKITYYNRNIVFYEYGVGISTSKNDKWTEIINNEFLAAFEYLSQKYPKNKPVAAACHYYSYENGIKEKIGRIAKYPSVCIVQLINRFRKKTPSKNDDGELKIISQIVNSTH